MHVRVSDDVRECARVCEVLQKCARGARACESIMVM